MEFLSPRALTKILMTLTMLGFMGVANAGNIILTGHDVLLHSGQRGFDAAALDFLRDGTAKADYNIAVVGTESSGFARFTGQSSNLVSVGHDGAVPLTGTLSGYGSAVFWDAEKLATSGTSAGNAAASFASVDAIVILSHTSCGGCSLTTAGADALEGLAPEIASAFNANMDIYGNSGASDSTFYNFLPPAVATSGVSIGGSSGFTCTSEGETLFGTSGCAASGSMINGFPTHNRFTDFDSDFTIFEVRDDEVITIGLKDGTIGDGGIGVGDDPVSVPEPGSIPLLAGGLLALFLRFRARADRGR